MVGSDGKGSLKTGCTVTVVMGAGAPHTEAVRAFAQTAPYPCRVIAGADNMAQLMAQADLSIGAAGSSAWERCCMGLSGILLVLAENQRTVAARLHAGEPLAYLLGHQPFCGLDLKVSRATLIPRSDSEILVERALHHLRDLHAPTVIDLGTGSGALALAIATARPDAHVTATDQSAEALAIAQENAHAHRLTNLTFLQADWLAPFAADCADLILSNPPYISANDPHLAALTHEPPSALIAAADGYRDLYTIMQQAPRNLKPNGWLLMEHGWQQGEKLRARATSSGDWHNIATHQDYAGRDRITEMQKRG